MWRTKGEKFDARRSASSVFDDVVIESKGLQKKQRAITYSSNLWHEGSFRDELQSIDAILSKMIAKKQRSGKKFELRIDDREPVEIKRGFEGCPNAQVKRFDLGDFHIVCNDKIEFIVERKTINDLSNGIGDIYDEQRIRIKNFPLPPYRKCYILEHEKPSRYWKGISTMTGAKVNLFVRDNLYIFDTKHHLDTIYTVKKIFLKAMQFDGVDNTDDVYTYSNTIRTKKKDNVSPTMVFLTFLRTLPNIGPSYAKAIHKKYTNFCGFQRMMTVDRETWVTELGDIKNESGKRLGAKRAAVLYKIIRDKD